MGASGHSLSIKLLNHASYLLHVQDMALLVDPWYEGTCFRNGWGLRYDNPAALGDACRATHLWISHFHGDHLHLPTLRQIAARAPEMRVLANVSANFEMITPLTLAGFKRVEPIHERREITLAPGITATRYPATGIDNMLVVKAGGMTVLNLNDCNLPKAALKSLVRRIGPIDVLLVNFNHAYKLMDEMSIASIKTMLKDRFLTILEAVQPRTVIPFASMHYYRAKASVHQNDSMLTSQELAELDPRVLAMGFGDEAVFKPGQAPSLGRRVPAIEQSKSSVKEHTKAASWEELLGAAEAFRVQIAKHFLGLTFWLKPITLFVTDHGKFLEWDIRKGVSEVAGGAPQIAAHSQALMEWFATTYGTDAFFVGADFEIKCRDTSAVKKLILAVDLVDNGLSPKHLVGMILTVKGIPFLWNRREEIWAILMSRKFAVGYRT